MGYIEANLLADEQVIYKARLHWIIFAKAFALIVLGLVFLLIQPIIGAVVAFIGLAASIAPMVAYLSSEFGVTNKRVSHVEAISVDQSVAGRMLNYGALTLTGTGGVKESFDKVSSPLEFRRRIQGEAA